MLKLGGAQLRNSVSELRNFDSNSSSTKAIHIQCKLNYNRILSLTKNSLIWIYHSSRASGTGEEFKIAALSKVFCAICFPITVVDADHT
jgi:hypothetical protein